MGLDCASGDCTLRSEVRQRLEAALYASKTSAAAQSGLPARAAPTSVAPLTRGPRGPTPRDDPADPATAGVAIATTSSAQDAAPANTTATSTTRTTPTTTSRAASHHNATTSRKQVPCSASGEDCTKSQCCDEAGLQCYEKTHRNWATCREACTPGPDPTDANADTWTCKELGPRTAGEAPPSAPRPKADWVDKLCSRNGEDCSKSMCCKAAGNQCFKKDNRWATCRSDCLPGPLLTDVNSEPWSCLPLGSRTPGTAARLAPVPVPKWVATECSGPGEDCSKTHCCSRSGAQCFEKEAGSWAACKVACEPGQPDPEDRNDHPWTCARLGPRTGEASWHETSLYCFSIIRDTGYEPELIRAQLPLGAGIFGCDEYGLYSTGSAELGEDVFGPVVSTPFAGAEVGTSKDGTAANTALFLNAWEAVNKDGRLWNHDWTVKVDPDAVLLPDRLRVHLKPFTGGNAYIVNCDKPGMAPMMFGSVEVYSFQAMQTYFHSGMSCRYSLPIDSWGEDLFMGECLKTLGTSTVDDFSLLQDGVCKGVFCGDGAAAVFHPFKTMEGWMDCYKQAQR